MVRCEHKNISVSWHFSLSLKSFISFQSFPLTLGICTWVLHINACSHKCLQQSLWGWLAQMQYVCNIGLHLQIQSAVKITKKWIFIYYCIANNTWTFTWSFSLEKVNWELRPDQHLPTGQEFGKLLLSEWRKGSVLPNTYYLFLLFKELIIKYVIQMIK